MLSKVTNIQLNLTTACNMRCKHCYAPKQLHSMSATTLHNAIDFCIDVSKQTKEDCLDIILSGGEMHCYDLDLLGKEIDRLKASSAKPIYISCQTNLTYKITDKELDFFKKCDRISTSWDYLIRFDKITQEKLFFDNLHLLQKYDMDLRLIISITDKLVKAIKPEQLFSFLMATGVKLFEFNRMFAPSKDVDPKYNIAKIATNAEIREWMFESYKIYDTIRSDDFRIFDLDNITEAVHGNFRNVYSGGCSKETIDINPLGTIAACLMENDHPYGNVNTGGIDPIKFNEQLERDKQKRQECLVCKYFEYCHGDCPCMFVDETGCSVPYKAFDYVRLKEELLTQNTGNKNNE